MKRSIAPVLLLVLAGCTSGRVPDSLTSTGATSTVAVAAAPTGGIAGSDMAVTVQPGLIEFAVPASAESVWQAVPVTLLELGLPVSSTNEQTKLMVSQNTRVSRIAGRRPSTYFRCGGTYTDDADSGRATVIVRMQVLPGADATSSRVRTEIRATAASTGGATAGECGSTGSLEQLIARTLREKTGTPPG
jgi:hypothetical protein